MAIKIDNITVSQDDSLQNIPGFSGVLSVLTSLHSSGLITRMSGNCLGTTDIIGTMLYQKGIKSYVTECQASVDRIDNGVTLIGYENFLGEHDSSQIDTHAVLIVVLEDAHLLLDASISFALPAHHPIILEKINGNSPEVIAEYKFSDLNIVYSSKKTVKVPQLHNMNLISNLLAERNNDKKIATLKHFLYAAIGLGAMNMIINIALIILKLSPNF